MNVLILSCGTRNKLVQYFQSCFDKVIVTDCSDFAPAIYVADGYYIVPRMTELNYLDIIIDICIKEQIDVVIPLQEDELLLMSKEREIFEKNKIWLVVSPYEVIMLCRDKYSFAQWMNEKGISTVPTHLPEDADMILDKFGEVMVKERYGAGSVGNMHIKSKLLLETYIDSTPCDLVIQPYIHGKEFGVDVFVDRMSKRVTSIFIKEKIRMRAGETEKSISVVNNDIYKLILNTIEKLQFVGPIDIDILEKDGEYFVLEINPRFGGGYPHAYECGVNFPRYILKNGYKEKNNESIFMYPEGKKCMKYSDVIIA